MSKCPGRKWGVTENMAEEVDRKGECVCVLLCVCTLARIHVEMQNSM